jgi:gamma-glutamyltranspeptidase/glutathione hydrolase
MDLTARKEYLASRAHLFDPTRANPEVIHGNPVNSSDTVYFTGMHE